MSKDVVMTKHHHVKLQEAVDVCTKDKPIKVIGAFHDDVDVIPNGQPRQHTETCRNCGIVMVIEEY